MPDLIDDVPQPPNDIIATGFKHFRRNLADARGSVICTAFFTSSTVTGSVEHSRDGSAACEEASRSRSRLTGGWWSKLLKCSIHREMQPLSLLMIWPSLSFTRDVFIECLALALRRILKTWEKLLVWAAISRRSASSFQNFRRSLRIAALRSRISLRYSAKFPERRADRR